MYPQIFNNMFKINIEQTVNITVGNKSLDEFLELVCNFAHDFLKEESIYRQETGMSEIEFAASVSNAHEILDILKD